MFMDFMEDLKDLRRTVERHSDRLKTIEENIAKDHRTLEKVSTEVEKMKDEITIVKNDVKIIKTESLQTNASIRTLTKWVKAAIGIAIVAFVYSIIRNESVASGIAALTTTITKLVL